MKHLLEICAADIQSVHAAKAAGADRVELCCALSEGGLTPSAGQIKAAIEINGPLVNVLIRPRCGDFVYDEAEIEEMVADIEFARNAGANAVVVGALLPDGEVDVEACRRFKSAAGAMKITFHRAFDMVKDPFASLDTIASLGFDKILTSGLKPTALEGKEMLRKLNEYSSGRISIIAASGVNPGNALDILESTGVNELHASASHTIGSPMRFRNETAKMGADDADEFSRSTTSEEKAALLAQIIHNYNP